MVMESMPDETCERSSTILRKTVLLSRRENLNVRFKSLTISLIKSNQRTELVGKANLSNFIGRYIVSIRIKSVRHSIFVVA